MTLLESISPTARALLQHAFSGGGNSMKFLVKAGPSRRKLRVHQATANHAPVCGGGNGRGRYAWQEDIGPCNCLRCQQITQRKNEQPS